LEKKKVSKENRYGKHSVIASRTKKWRGTAVPVSNEYVEFVIGQLEPMGTVVSKRMFGGAGLYLDGVFFAIIENDTLRFKVDDSNRADYEKAGMGPFRPYKGKDHTMQYYEVPVEVLEDSDVLSVWARKALAVASTAKNRKAGG